MTEKVKELSPVILESIKASKCILMHCHPSPDPDSVGSVLAMMHALEGMGKNVTAIIGDSEKPANMAHLPGFEKILNKNWGEIDPKDFDLMIALDSGSKGMITKGGNFEFPRNLKVVVIDHHESNDKYGHINLVDTSYPATGQIVYDLLNLWQIEISPSIAACLFLSIYFDTGGFKYKPASDETFKAAVKLSSIYPDFSQVVFEFENKNEPQVIFFEGLALNNVHTYFGGKVAIAEVAFDQLAQLSIEKKHTENSQIANKLKSVAGWDIGISFVECEEGEFKLSFRTRNPEKFDVSKIAEALGGGGHKAAAGASITRPFKKAKEKLLRTISKTYPELESP